MLGDKVFLETWVKVKKIGVIRSLIWPILVTMKKNIKRALARLSCWKEQMPELPEVETVRRGLERLVVGRTILSVEVKVPK